jgi:hypothetical protein
MRLTAFLAFTSYLAIAGAMAQQVPYLTFAPASGDVLYYEARIRTLDETVVYVSPDATPRVEIPALPLEPFYIDVRGVSAVGVGPWSPLHWNTLDLNGDGEVGFLDWMQLVREWPAPGRGILAFIELSRRWGDATEANDEGLRRYK